jgi:hypothetical protein
MVGPPRCDVPVRVPADGTNHTNGINDAQGCAAARYSYRHRLYEWHNPEKNYHKPYLPHWGFSPSERIPARKRSAPVLGRSNAIHQADCSSSIACISNLAAAGDGRTPCAENKKTQDTPNLLIRFPLRTNFGKRMPRNGKGFGGRFAPSRVT